MKTAVCFCVKPSTTGDARSDGFERNYQNVYKPAAKFLYSHPNCCMAFSFYGPQLAHLKRRRPEFIEIMRELLDRAQTELLGGGFYNPVFPLLFPRDRSGQIEMLSSELRQATGKRPRGLSICASSWESSLLASFATSGMEYVLLDESLVPAEKRRWGPLIMSDKGKSLSVLPVSTSLKPCAGCPPEAFLSAARERISASRSASAEGGSSVVCVQVSTEELQQLLETGWLSRLDAAVCAEGSGFSFATPYRYLKSTPERTPVYIAAGLGSDVAQWAVRPYESVRPDGGFPVTIYDFFQTYPQSRALYDRMLYVGQLVNQSHGDKLRRKAAREKLWEAQNGDGFICTADGAFVSSAYRQQAYKKLMEAEKILRECGPFAESVSSFDYTGDGMNEYVCRMKNFFACISRRGGAVRELDVAQNSGNFADNLSRVGEFDGCSDDYERGLFVDHLFTQAEFQDFVADRPAGNGIFSRMVYDEVRFSAQHKEIQMSVSALFGGSLKVALRKKYIVTSGGMVVQYILRNEGDRLLSAKFAVESSSAQTNFNARNFNAFRLEIVTDGKKRDVVDTKSASIELNESGLLSAVDGVQLTDTDNRISFVLEPNEGCGLFFIPIVFRRPEYTTGELVPAGMTFAHTMFWDVSLEPGREMEKTINFSILHQHRARRASKST